MQANGVGLKGRSAADLAQAFGVEAGDLTSLKVERGGETLELEVQLQVWPPRLERSAPQDR
ncbi:MAG: hypothetical protein AB1486_13670 [Planctomycetota bacterium]